MTAPEEFGDPATGSTGYRLCVYDHTGGTPRLVVAALAAAGATCARNRPCWTRGRALGFRYADKTLLHGGPRTILLQAGTRGVARIVVAGSGGPVRVSSPRAPRLLHQDTAVTVQLVRDDGGGCWEAVYPAPAVKLAADRFKDILP